jgi:hypothetical protein
VKSYKNQSTITISNKKLNSCKKVFPGYELKEVPYLGFVILESIIGLNEVLSS